MNGLAAEIAAALPTVNGASWRLRDDDNHHPSLELHADGDLLGPVLYLYVPYQKSQTGKVEISGSYPQGFWPTERPRIGCSVSRGAFAIAQDIERRMLPEYLDAYDKAAAQEAESIAYHKRSQATAKHLAGLIPGCEVQPKHSSDDTPTLFLPHHAQARIYGDSVRFEYMSVPLAVAETIIRALAGKPDLTEFALEVLSIMEGDKDWSTDTLDQIEERARMRNLCDSDDEAMFRSLAGGE